MDLKTHQTNIVHFYKSTKKSDSNLKMYQNNWSHVFWKLTIKKKNYLVVVTVLISLHIFLCISVLFFFYPKFAGRVSIKYEHMWYVNYTLSTPLPCHAFTVCCTVYSLYSIQTCICTVQYNSSEHVHNEIHIRKQCIHCNVYMNSICINFYAYV